MAPPGGLDTALAQGAAEIATLGLPRSPAATAIALGAGFGMHAIPLARAGWRVTAIDPSPDLLDVLRREAGDARLLAVEADLLAFREYAPAQAELILCMGDVLTSLPDLASVDRLLGAVAGALAPGGRFVATFRDYTTPARDAPGDLQPGRAPSVTLAPDRVRARLEALGLSARVERGPQAMVCVTAAPPDRRFADPGGPRFDRSW